MLRESGEKGRKVGGRVVVSLSGSFETTDKPLSCLLPVDLHWFFEISIRTEKKISVRTEKKNQL